MGLAGIFVISLISCSGIEGNVLCLQCNGVQLPSDCTQIKTCDSNQVCFLEKTISSIGQVTYNSGCRNTSACPSGVAAPFIGRRSISKRMTAVLCTECCKGDYCNVFGCESLEEECYRKRSSGYFYDSTSDTCLHVVKASGRTFNQSEAEDLCQSQGAEIITINKEADQQFLLSWIYTHYRRTTDFWIGLKANVTGSRTFLWPNDQPVTYKNWGKTMLGQPTDLYTKTEDCVYMKSSDDYHWYDDDCGTAKSGFICEITGSNTVAECRQKVFRGFFYDRRTAMCIHLVDVSPQLYDFRDAEKACLTDNATLVTVDSRQKMEFLNRWINSNRANAVDFWIGARDRTNSSNFTWPNGIALNYTNWGGPDLPPLEHSQPDELFYQKYDTPCVYLSGTEMDWFDEKCNATKRGYICQHTGATEIETEMGCYSLLGNHFFFDYRTKMCVKVVNGTANDRFGAQRQCERFNSTLVEITSQTRSRFIHNLVFSLGKNGTDFWIGGMDIYKNGTFYWMKSRQVFKYTNWHIIPTQDPTDCVVLDRTDDFRWNPQACSSQKEGYICQIDRDTVTRTIIKKLQKLQTTTATSPTTSTAVTTTTTITTTTTTYPTTTTTQYTTTTTSPPTTTIQSTTRIPSTTTTLQTSTSTAPTTFKSPTGTSPTATTATQVTTSTTMPITTSMKPSTTTIQKMTTAMASANATTRVLTSVVLPTAKLTNIPISTTSAYKTTTPITPLTTVKPITTGQPNTPASATTTTWTPTQTTETTTRGRTYSPDGYFDISNRSSSRVCIKLYNTYNLQYQDASNICMANGAVLVFPRSQEMMDDIKNYMDNKYPKVSTFYIGVINPNGTGIFTSTEGDPLVYTNWQAGEPTRRSQCARANKVSGYQWQAIRCIYKIPFICQKPHGC